MKNYFIIIGIIFIQNCFCQEYKFDTFSCYYNDNVHWKQIILTNNSNEKLKVILNQKNDFFIGAIQEFTKDSLMYHFIEVRIDSTKGLEFQVKYTSSMKGKLKESKNCFDENNFYEISNNEIKNEVVISRFKNLNKNKLISKVTLNVKKIDFNFINHFAYGYFNTRFIDCQTLQMDKNLLIEKATFSGDINYTLTLIDYKHIPIIINIGKPIYNTK